MRRSLQILLAHAILIITTAMTLQQPKRVIFFGDSITQMGVQPGGYISRIREGLESKGAGSAFELIGAGISGNKVYDLFFRMDDDVLRRNPDIVVVYIGVNDVWHKTLAGTGTDAERFEKFYVAIIEKLQKRNISVVLCTPAVIGERIDGSNQQDGDLNFYSNIVRKLATRYHAPLVDLRKAFLEYGSRNNPDNKPSGILTTDQVHLNEKGNQLVADLIMAVLLER